ncbi:MAG: rhodanese-like domain-containing protein [Bdellovibrionales bacterium]|nr:rhodanese-like domain-containing protein [Oligoflexia bacterium]
MNLNLNQNLILPFLLIAFFVFRYLRGRLIRNKVQLLLSENPVIVDVRSEPEFRNGGNPHSINIPLPSISADALKDIPRDRQLILCCASGMRSSMAMPLIKRLGYQKVLNAGSWTNTLKSS